MVGAWFGSRYRAYKQKFVELSYQNPLLTHMRDKRRLFWSLRISVLSTDIPEELPSFRVSFLKQLPFFFFFFASTQVLALFVKTN